MKDVIHLSPITRIEGHLGVQVDIDDGKVTAARVTGEMFRGFENILRGRHPLDAQQITQRICGVCPVEHGVASIRAQDMAYKTEVPENGRLLRNLIQAANFITSHITHFYLLSGLDFVNVASLLSYTGNDRALIGLRDWAKEQLQTGSVNPVGPFLPQWPAGLLENPELNATVLRHYVDAIAARRTGHKLGALFAGKLPHAASLVPGGVTEQATAIKITQARALLDELRAFYEQSYLPDIIGVAGAFPEYFKLGRSCGNFLAYDAFPEADGRPVFAAGSLCDAKLQGLNIGQISEDVRFSWFSSGTGLHPKDGQTKPAPDKAGAYSWLKAPRYEGRPMEVGALARLLVTSATPGYEALGKHLHSTLKSLSLPVSALDSVLGRHLARGLETGLLIERCEAWLDALKPDQPSFTDFKIPDACEGYGLTEAARGALGHWIRVSEGRIANYQCVVPTTWNCSPRDDRGVAGPMEKALEGTAIADPKAPIEVARIIRSFDPCLACAVH